MALSHIHFIEDPEGKILPGYYEIDNCQIRVFSLAWFGLMNIDVAYIRSPNTEKSYLAMSKWFSDPPKMTRPLTTDEVNNIIDDLKALIKKFDQNDHQSAKDLLTSALRSLQKTTPGVPGGITSMDESDVNENYHQDQMDSE